MSIALSKADLKMITEIVATTVNQIQNNNIQDSPKQPTTTPAIQPIPQISYREGMNLFDKMTAVQQIKTLGFPSLEEPLQQDSKMVKRFFVDNNIKGLRWMSYAVMINRVDKYCKHKKLKKSTRQKYYKNTLSCLNNRVKELKADTLVDPKVKERRLKGLEQAIAHAKKVLA